MLIVHDLKSVESRHHGAVIAMADFDGVHRGHQAMIADAASVADQLGAPLGVFNIDPGASGAASRDSRPLRLMNPEQQARALDALGIDILYALPPDAQPTDIDEEQFARVVLGQGLRVRHVIVGAELVSRFGVSPPNLVHHGEAQGFSVTMAAHDRDLDTGKFSSDAARAALGMGQPELAAEILGRPFAIGGTVVEGQKLGRTIGYPTANVAASAYVRPKLGVYATRSRLADGREAPGAANFGVNPTTGLVEARLEVFLFDFDEDIYGQTLETDLLAFLRPELKFDDLPAMVAQIRQDVIDARAIAGPASIWR